MAIKKVNTKQIANNPETPSPVFNFYSYETGRTYYNDENQVDFVTYDGSLYVCTDREKYAEEPTPERNGGFLLIVRKGETGRQGVSGRDGANGSTPEIKVKFEGKHLVIYDAITQTRLASSPELVGPTWKPIERDGKLTWELDEGTPDDIDLDDLRPKEERPILLRLNSDNTKRSDEESGPGYFIQWKREGNEEWTNLMSISELMNIALAGVSFWWQDSDSETDQSGNPIRKLHFGHRQVVKATYDSSKTGLKKIAEVILGDVLFDAGEVPFANYDDDIAAITVCIQELETSLNSLIDSIPTRLSQLENDVPFIKSINEFRPNNNGEIKLRRVDNIELVGDNANIPFATINGRRIVNSIDNFVIPDNYLTEANIKTLSGQSLIKGSTVDSDLPLKTINNQSIIGVGNISIPGGGSGDGTGVDDIQFRVENNTLQYRVSINGTWGSWSNIALPSGSGGQSEHVDLRINNGILQIRYDNGNWQDVGSVGGGSGSGDTVNGFVGVTKSGDDLIFTKQDGTTVTVTLPSGSCDLSNYYTKSQVDALIGTPMGSTSYKQFSVYKRTNSPTTAPTKPAVNDWKWYVAVDNLLHSASDSSVDTVSGWTNNPPAISGNNKYLWASWNIFESVNGTCDNVAWTDPICMTGEDGTDGVDGDSIKFIFKLASDSSNVPSAPSQTAPNFDNTVWSDDAQGIDINHKAEFYCYTTKASNGVWSSWRGPFLWSLWGENGTDGNGVEYIYLNQASANVAVNNDPSKLANSVLESAAYQTADYVPKTGAALSPSGTLGVDWTDEPSGVSSTYPYEFVCVRKYDGATQTWGAFSEPKVWAHFGADGVGLVETDIIVPLSTTIAKTEVSGSNPVSYKATGTATWQLYHNGTQVTNGYCEAYIGSYTSGTALTVTNTSGTYSITANNNWTGDSFVQLLWYEGNNNLGKVLDTVLIPIIIPGERGADGSSAAQSLDGPVMRVRTYDSATHYYDESNPVNGIYYIDVVYYNGNYYKCISSCENILPTNTTYWTAYSFLGDAAFNTLLANAAYIKNLTSKQVVITDSNNAIEAGMASSTNVNNQESLNGITVGNIRIWAGPYTSSNLANAPFTVSNTGYVKMDSAQIGGQNGITVTGNGITLGSDCTIGYSNVSGTPDLSTYVTATQITTGAIKAKTAEFDYLYINGSRVGENNSWSIKFGNVSMATTDPNTIYFLY